MKKIIAALLIVFALFVAGAGSLVFLVLYKRSSTPLRTANNGKPAAPLPKDALVLTVSEGAEVSAPFQIHDEAGAVGGTAAFMPKGSRTEEKKGRVIFNVKSETAGTFQAFVHAKWRDTCSNSCALKVNQGDEFTAGNDDVFSVWHWVSAGKHKLNAGANAISIVEREDGIYIDQILFTQKEGYIPSGAIGTAGVTREVRRFADTFLRSPGHGNEGWDFEGKGKFEVAFSFDPNRIPNQYALTGNAANGPCYATVKGAPWYGCKVSFSFQPTTEGVYGAALDGTEGGVFAGFEFKDGAAFARIDGAGASISEPLKDALRLKQWHRVVIERWAWITRIFLDGKMVASSDKIKPKSGKAGLCVTRGTAVFDDFEIEETPWLADDGGEFKIDWSMDADSKWFRENDEAGALLRGESGTIKAGLGGIPLEEIFLDKANQLPVPAVDAPGLVTDKASLRLPPLADGSCTHASLSAAANGSAIRRIALRFGRRAPDVFSIGPYTFTHARIEDPSDYLDFTREEYEAMARSSERDKLERQAKTKPVLGYGGAEEESPWLFMGGNFSLNLREGCLSGRGTASRIRHAQEIASDMETRLKVRITEQSAAELELYSGAEPGVRVQFVAAVPAAAKSKLPPLPPEAALQLEVQPDGKWHEVTLRVDGSKLTAKLDRNAARDVDIHRPEGDRIYLKMLRGTADFDDIEFVAQRVTDKSVLYAFNQAEPDWWREPAEAWIDHGGIACVLASSWVSMVAPTSQAMMWHKKNFGPDVMVAYNVEENTEWYGWDKPHSHTHFTFDNVETVLASATNPAECYRLVVNAEQHSATLLLRNGVEVARTRQDGKFPMRFVGSHMPFFPRTNRFSLVKRGGVIQGIVNGVKVIEYNDPQPLAVSRVGLGGFQTRVNFSHVEIRDLTAEVQPKTSSRVENSNANFATSERR